MYEYAIGGTFPYSYTFVHADIFQHGISTHKSKSEDPRCPPKRCQATGTPKDGCAVVLVRFAAKPLSECRRFSAALYWPPGGRSAPAPFVPAGLQPASLLVIATPGSLTLGYHWAGPLARKPQ